VPDPYGEECGGAARLEPCGHDGASADVPRIIPYAAEPRVLSFQLLKILASARDGIAMSRREFIDVLGGASIAWSLAFPDARGQELRKAYRVGFLTLSQLK